MSEINEHLERIKEHLPSTAAMPDYDSDSDEGSWEFVLDGHRATRKFMIAGLNRQLIAEKGGELITFINPVHGADMVVEVLDREGAVASRNDLRAEGTRVFVDEGLAFRMIAGSKSLVEFVTEYPGQEPVIEDV